MCERVKHERTYFCPHQRRVRLCRRNPRDRDIRALTEEIIENHRGINRAMIVRRGLVGYVSAPYCELEDRTA